MVTKGDGGVGDKILKILLPRTHSYTHENLGSEN